VGHPDLFLKTAYEGAWLHVNEIRRVTPLVYEDALSLLAAIVGLLALDIPKRAEPPPPPSSVEANWPLLNDYCVQCHNATDWAGGVAFDTLQPESVGTTRRSGKKRYASCAA